MIRGVGVLFFVMGSFRFLYRSVYDIPHGTALSFGGEAGLARFSLRLVLLLQSRKPTTQISIRHSLSIPHHISYYCLSVCVCLVGSTTTDCFLAMYL